MTFSVVVVYFCAQINLGAANFIYRRLIASFQLSLPLTRSLKFTSISAKRRR